MGWVGVWGGYLIIKPQQPPRVDEERALARPGQQILRHSERALARVDGVEDDASRTRSAREELELGGRRLRAEAQA